MTLFLNLYLGHLLGDFVLQPGKLVLAKRRGMPGLLIHTGIIGLTCAAATAGSLSRLWHAIVLVVVAHGVIEVITIIAYKETPTRGLFTFLLDQALHIVSIAAIVWVLGEWSLATDTTTFGMSISTGALARVVGFVAVGFMGSILVFETSNALHLPADHKDILLRLDSARLYGVLERTVSLAAALWLGWLALPLPFVPRLLSVARLPAEAKSRRLVGFVAGVLICALALVVICAIDSALG